MKAIMRIVLLSLLLGFIFGLIMSPWVAGAAELGMGGFVHNGHSYSSDDKIDPGGYVGHGMRIFVEGDREHDSRLDFTYIGRIDFIQFGKRNNETMRVKWEQMAGPSVEGRTYLRLFQRCSFYTGVGVGYSIATDGNAPFATVSYGLEERINDSWAIEVGGANIVTTERRHDLYGFNLKYSF